MRRPQSAFGLPLLNWVYVAYSANMLQVRKTKPAAEIVFACHRDPRTAWGWTSEPVYRCGGFSMGGRSELTAVNSGAGGCAVATLTWDPRTPLRVRAQVMVGQAKEMAGPAREAVIAGVAEAEAKKAAREQGGASTAEAEEPVAAGASGGQAVNPFGCVQYTRRVLCITLRARDLPRRSIPWSPFLEDTLTPVTARVCLSSAGFGLNQTAAALFSRRFPELEGETYHATCPVMWREGGKDQQGQLYVTDRSVALHGTFGRGKQIVKLAEARRTRRLRVHACAACGASIGAARAVDDSL